MNWIGLDGSFIPYMALIHWFEDPRSIIHSYVERKRFASISSGVLHALFCPRSIGKWEGLENSLEYIWALLFVSNRLRHSIRCSAAQIKIEWIT